MNDAGNNMNDAGDTSRRSLILKTAATLFRQHGYERTSVRQIAEAAALGLVDADAGLVRHTVLGALNWTRPVASTGPSRGRATAGAAHVSFAVPAPGRAPGLDRARGHWTREHADFGLNACTSTDYMRGCLARTVANDQWPDARVFVDRFPRASIGLICQTRLRKMYRDRKWKWRKPQPAPALKDWHVKPMEKK